MSAPALGLNKKPSLTQEREKLEKDQVNMLATCHKYWLFILRRFASNVIHSDLYNFELLKLQLYLFYDRFISVNKTPACEL